MSAHRVQRKRRARSMPSVAVALAEDVLRAQLKTLATLRETIDGKDMRADEEASKLAFTIGSLDAVLADTFVEFNAIKHALYKRLAKGRIQ